MPKPQFNCNVYGRKRYFTLNFMATPFKRRENISIKTLNTIRDVLNEFIRCNTVM